MRVLIEPSFTKTVLFFAGVICLYATASLYLLCHVKANRLLVSEGKEVYIPLKSEWITALYVSSVQHESTGYATRVHRTSMTCPSASAELLSETSRK